MRTLFSVVASQGGRLSYGAWEECLWQMLFPLLRSVHHTAATSSKEEASFHLLRRHAICTQTLYRLLYLVFCQNPRAYLSP